MNATTLQKLTVRGHVHIEAFCLMWYACKSCYHRELLWNSRDGVTPFGTACPSCGAPDLMHVEFYRDQYAPHHIPHHGQRMWVNMTRERAQLLATARLEIVKTRRRTSEAEAEAIHQSLFDAIYAGGAAPDLVVCGYQPTAGAKP